MDEVGGRNRGLIGTSGGFRVGVSVTDLDEEDVGVETAAAEEDDFFCCSRRFFPSKCPPSPPPSL